MPDTLNEFDGLHEKIQPTRGKTGFTLIELCIVVIVISLLAALLIPTIRLVQQSFLTSKCANNQRNIAVALITYSNDWRGTFPYAYDSRIGKLYDSYISDYLPKVPGYGLHQSIGRMYDCPAIRYNRLDPIYSLKGPDYGLNSAIIPRYTPGTAEGRIACITRASEVILLGDASAGMGIGLSMGSYYMLVTPLWVNTRQRTPWSSFPCARHPMPHGIVDQLDGLSVGGKTFIGVMADCHIANISVDAPEFATPAGRLRTFTLP